MTMTMAETTATCTYTVPRALMIDEQNAAVIFERAPGETLDSMLRRRGPAQVATPLRRAGTWLRLMQEQTRTGEDSGPILTAVLFLALRDLDLAAAADRTVRRHRRAIADQLRSLESYVHGRLLPVVGHHGDFSPANVFVSARHIEVVNVDDFRDGLPLGDVASFLLRLEAAFPRHRHAGATFLAGYSDAPIDPSSLQFFRMAKALEILARTPDGVTPSGAARRRLIDVVIGGPR
jgi:Ser/Thr protein kinase RdoA (MazF antagonist)